MKNLTFIFALVLISFVSSFGQNNKSFVKTFPMSDTFDISALGVVEVIEVENNQVLANIEGDSVKDVITTVKFYAQLEVSISMGNIKASTVTSVVKSGIYGVKSETNKDSKSVVTTTISNKYNKGVVVGGQATPRSFKLYVPKGTVVKCNQSPTK